MKYWLGGITGHWKWFVTNSGGKGNSLSHFSLVTTDPFLLIPKESGYLHAF